MIEVILGIGVAAFIVYAAFNIVYLMGLKKSGDSMALFVKNSEGNVNATLVELKGTLENLRKISGDISEITEDVKQISNSVSEVEKSIRDLFDQIKEDLGSAAEANIAGLKAGISTGVSTLVKNLYEGRRDDHERGTD